jgi:hypothetical protein
VLAHSSNSAAASRTVTLYATSYPVAPIDISCERPKALAVALLFFRFPPAPSHFYHYEKMIFNRVYWYIVPRGIV